MLIDAVNRHIDLCRSMGFKYQVQANMLHGFASFAQGRSEEFIRTDSVLEWATSAPSVRQRHDRLRTVHRLACSLNAEDQRHQVPPIGIFGGEPRRPRWCHIFTQEEIDRLLRAAADLTPKGSIRPITYTTLLSLIACTGLRISEALKLGLGDFAEDGLVIRATKFQKSRLVPLHESARSGLRCYLAVRNRITTTASTVFVSLRGEELRYSRVNATFLQLARSVGLRGGPGLGGCRIHDLRHTFAVRSLEQCTGDRKAVASGGGAVTSRWISDAELEANPGLVRTMSVKPPMGTGRVRLIEIAGLDLQPCGGTHVRNVERNRRGARHADREEGQAEPAGAYCVNIATSSFTKAIDNEQFQSPRQPLAEIDAMARRQSRQGHRGRRLLLSADAEARRPRRISQRPHSRRGILRHQRHRRQLHRPAAHAAGAEPVRQNGRRARHRREGHHRCL